MFEFWLIDESNGINMILPVSPGSYAVDYGNKMEVINATEIGDINIAGHKNPLAMELEGFLPCGIIRLYKKICGLPRIRLTTWKS